MSQVLSTFNLKNCSIIYSGIPLTGLIEFKYTPDGEDYEYSAGNNGGSERIANNANGGATLALQFLQTNPVHDLLSAQRIKERTTNLKGTFLFKDFFSATLYQGLSYIMGRPEDTRNGSSNPHTWMFKLPQDHTNFAGGDLL